MWYASSYRTNPFYYFAAFAWASSSSSFLLPFRGSGFTANGAFPAKELLADGNSGNSADYRIGDIRLQPVPVQNQEMLVCRGIDEIFHDHLEVLIDFPQIAPDIANFARKFLYFSGRLMLLQAQSLSF